MKIITFFILLFVFMHLICFAQETMTITTYYPSPFGIYKELRTTHDTYLATEGGNVGVGTDAPEAKLDVNGLIKLGFYDDSVGSGNKPPNASHNEGAIYYDTAGKSIYYSNGFNWLPMDGGSKIEVGSYVGTGSSNVITLATPGLPDSVMIMSHNTSSSQPWVSKTSAMGGNYSKEAHGPYHNNAITGLIETGFTLGTNQVVNQSGITYSYIAIKGE